MNQIMVDIETISARPNAAICAIGAAAFSFESGETKTFYCEVDWQDHSERLGAHIDPNTQKWWNEQKPEARKVLEKKADTLRIEDGLKLFSDWVVSIRRIAPKMELGIWGNDINFDLTILESAFRATNQADPWQFWESRSVRTLVWLGKQFGIDPKKTIPREGVYHNAVDDSLHQTKYCKAIVEHIKKGNKNG